MCWLLLPPVDSVVQADTMQFTPDRDNTLYEDTQGDISNGSGDGTPPMIGTTAG